MGPIFNGASKKGRLTWHETALAGESDKLRSDRMWRSVTWQRVQLNVRPVPDGRHSAGGAWTALVIEIVAQFRQFLKELVAFASSCLQVEDQILHI